MALDGAILYSPRAQVPTVFGARVCSASFHPSNDGKPALYICAHVRSRLAPAKSRVWGNEGFP
jgi:hypothetical protein